MCAKAKFVQYRYSDRGAPLYSGTPAPSSGLVKANFFVYYDFYNRLIYNLSEQDKNQQHTSTWVSARIASTQCVTVSGDGIESVDGNMSADRG